MGPGHFFQDAFAKGLPYCMQASFDGVAAQINFTGVYSEELLRMGEYSMGDEVRASAPLPA